MPSRNLTAAAVERIKPPMEGQADYFDKSYPGLVMRVSYGGSKTWSYVFRIHGKLRRQTLGRFPAMSLAEARDAWRDAHKLVSKGENPARQRPADADSFAVVAGEWLKRDQGKNRSVADVHAKIERNVMPAWRDRLIGTITRRDVIELIDAVEDRGAPIMARRLHAYLHRLFRWSVGRGIIEANPMADLPKPGEEVRRDRVLTDAEIVVVWKACEEIGWPFGPVVRLLMLTGARRDEIGALRWSEIYDDEIRLDGARTKNGEPHSIPLAPAAVKIIDGLPRIGEGELVFTITGKTPVSGWSKAKTALDEKATASNKGRALPDWRLHDLRRTVATGLQRLGTNLQVIEAVLGHVAGSRAGVVGVYQRHSFDAEKRAALNVWARHVEQIVSGKPAKVISIRGREKAPIPKTE
jgi:integrase